MGSPKKERTILIGVVGAAPLHGGAAPKPPPLNIMPFIAPPTNAVIDS